jgi:hypothetical protein
LSKEKLKIGAGVRKKPLLGAIIVFLTNNLIVNHLPAASLDCALRASLGTSGSVSIPEVRTESYLTEQKVI